MKAAEPFDLLLLITALDQDQKLLRYGGALRWPGRRERPQVRLGGRFPDGLQVGRDGWGQLQKTVVQLFLRLGQGGERVDAQEQGAGFVVGHAQSFTGTRPGTFRTTRAGIQSTLTLGIKAIN